MPWPVASEPFTAAVLCGGSSRRMGRDKALLRVDGSPMAVRVAEAARRAGAAEVFAVGGDQAALEAVGLAVRPDRWPGDGPLPATITALEEAAEPVVLVLSCDLVAPSAEAMAATVGALTTARAAQVAVPLTDGHRQWTHAAWRRVTIVDLQAIYEQGARSLRRAAGALHVVEVLDLDPTALADADEPGELPT